MANMFALILVIATLVTGILWSVRQQRKLLQVIHWIKLR